MPAAAVAAARSRQTNERYNQTSIANQYTNTHARASTNVMTVVEYYGVCYRASAESSVTHNKIHVPCAILVANVSNILINMNFTFYLFLNLQIKRKKLTNNFSSFQ